MEAHMDARLPPVYNQLQTSYASAIGRIVGNALYWAVVLQTDSVPLATVGAAHLSFSVIWLGMLRFAPNATQAMTGKYATRLADAILVTGAVHATGGAVSPLIFGYMLTTVFSSLHQDPRQGRAAVLFGTGLFGLLVLLRQLGILSPIHALAANFAGSSSLQALTVSCVLTLSCYAVYRITARLARVDREARLAAEEERSKADKARAEIEKLNDFSKKLNETTNLDEILDYISEYLSAEFGIEGMFLAQVDSVRREFYASKVMFPPSIPEDAITWLQAMRLPLSSASGSLMFTYQRRKPLYQRRVRRQLTAVDQMLSDRLQFRSFLQVPLIVRDEVIGIANFTKYTTELNLARSDIASISRFCDQIAGAIHGSSLYKQAAAARNAAEAEKVKAEKARGELGKLNEFSKKINETTNISEILNAIFAYMESELNIEGIILALVDSDRKQLSHYRASVLEHYTDAQLHFVRTNTIPLSPEGGIAYRAYLRKRPVYFARTARRIENETDRLFVDMLAIKSFLIVPLVIQNEVIGTILCTSFHQELKLSKGDIASIARFCEQIAGAIHSSSLLKQVQDARAVSDAQRFAAEKARAETTALNDFARKINETTDPDEIFAGISDYLQQMYGIESSMLLVPRAGRAELYVANARLGNPAHTAIAEQLTFPLNESGGLVYRTIVRKRPFFISDTAGAKNIFRKRYPGMDRDRGIIRTLSLKSLLILPLLIRGEATAVILLTSYDKQLILSKSDIRSIAAFGDQVAATIYTSMLMAESNIAREVAEAERTKSDKLLLNILPDKVATELKANGAVQPLSYEAVTVLFTDFVGFTKISESMRPDELVRELDGCFTQFDEVASRNRMEKLKTIGDSYMCCGGVPEANDTHPVDACLAGLEFQAFMNQMRAIKSALDLPHWQLRLGIHTGPVTAGVVGKSKFAYDVWGDAVNTASRCESSGTPGKVNISEATYRLVSDFFDCEYRGKVAAKGKGELDMYFVNRIRSQLSLDEDGEVPNGEFHRMYESLRMAEGEQSAAQPTLQRAPFAVDERSQGSVTVLTLSGPLNIHTAGALEERLARLLESRRTELVLNLEKLDSLDSSGLGAILKTYIRLEQGRGALRLASIPAAIRPLFEASNLGAYLDIHAAEDLAIASFGEAPTRFQSE